jgi:hypothetical protein
VITTLDQYFEMQDTPSKQSPLGLLMQRILEETPDMGFEDARKLAQTQLVKASGRRAYKVTTPAQDKESRERFSRRFNPTLEMAIAAD